MRDENELVREISRLIARLSEEAIVITAALVVLAYAQYRDTNMLLTSLILFVALGGYLSLRPFRIER